MIVTIAIIIIGAIMINICLDPLYRPDKDKMEKYFVRDKEDIILITDYFSNSDYSLIIFNHPNINANFDRLKIDDDLVLEAIVRLLNERGYSVIGKEQNTIFFQKWRSGADLSIGIAYSINDNDEPMLPHLTKLESLSESGWYFYEENFGEWRLYN